MSKGGRYAKRNTHGSTRSGGMTALIVIAVVLVLAIAALIGMMVYKGTMNKNQIQVPETTAEIVTLPPRETTETAATVAETTEEVTEAPTTETTLPTSVLGKEVMNILLVGQQARKGEATEGGRMADTMILATINMETKTLTLTSFLRDTLVSFPKYVDSNGKSHGFDQNRINMAYQFGYMIDGAGGAMQLTNDTIYKNFGAVVDYDVEVDFDGFVDIIDLLGGVDIELTEEEAEYLNNDDHFVYYDVNPGMQHLEGLATLSYARMRKAKGDADSDIKRTARQRKLITALIDKMKTTDLGHLHYVVEQAIGIITTNMSNEDILNAMWSVLPILPQLEIEQGTCPIQRDKYSWGRMQDIHGVPSSVLLFSERLNTEYMSALTTGQELPELPAK